MDLLTTLGGWKLANIGGSGGSWNFEQLLQAHLKGGSAFFGMGVGADAKNSTLQAISVRVCDVLSCMIVDVGCVQGVVGVYREWWVCTGSGGCVQGVVDVYRSGGCVQGVVGVYREWWVCTGSNDYVQEVICCDLCGMHEAWLLRWTCRWSSYSTWCMHTWEVM